MKIKILAFDRHKLAAAQELAAEYLKRLTWPAQVIDLAPKHDLEKYLSAGYIICMDERGDNLTSQEFAQLIDKVMVSGKDLTFIIGGAEGLSQEILARAHKKLAFGRQTWPHKFMKFMLLEQIYRAQQILSGHPYHK
jgi:23S rRNA (pseudouridine1915-N3)-methyltransferase